MQSTTSISDEPIRGITAPELFNQQIGKMNALSWFVIVIPTIVITDYARYLFLAEIKKITGLNMENAMPTK